MERFDASILMLFQFSGFDILHLLPQASGSVVELRTCVLRYCSWLLARRVLETLRTSGNLFSFYCGMAALHEPFQNMSVELHTLYYYAQHRIRGLAVANPPSMLGLTLVGLLLQQRRVNTSKMVLTWWASVHPTVLVGLRSTLVGLRSVLLSGSPSSSRHHVPKRR